MNSQKIFPFLLFLIGAPMVFGGLQLLFLGGVLLLFPGGVGHRVFSMASME